MLTFCPLFLLTKANIVPPPLLRIAKVIPPPRGGLNVKFCKVLSVPAGGKNVRFFQVLAAIRYPKWSIVAHLEAGFGRARNLIKPQFSPLSRRPPIPLKVQTVGAFKGVSIPPIVQFNYPYKAGMVP